MTNPTSEDLKSSFPSIALSSSPHPASSFQNSTSYRAKSRHRNVIHLLAQREVSPRTRHHAKRLWTNVPKSDPSSELRWESVDAKQALFSWVESKTLHYWSAKYCSLLPPPRSTIAAAFSSDGEKLASTHGDHTVKIIDCQTGKCVKVLSGHRRTPWVVRFHPSCTDILASGSLDHDVRLWDARTSNCIASRDFYRPIASISFHAKGELLAVASGHKLYIWHYNRRGESSAPAIVLRTRRSLRAVQFHPHGAPYLLTAEVNNLDSSESPLTLATSSGYSNCPPSLFFSDISSIYCPLQESRLSSPCLFWPAFVKGDGSICFLSTDWSDGQQRMQLHSQQQTNMDMDIHPEEPVISMDVSSGGPSIYSTRMEDEHTLQLGTSAIQAEASNISERTVTFSGEHTSTFSNNGMVVSSPSELRPQPNSYGSIPFFSLGGSNPDVQMLLRTADRGHINHVNPSRDLPSWELPFWQGWLMAQTHPGWNSTNPMNNNSHGLFSYVGESTLDNTTSRQNNAHNAETQGILSMETTSTNSRNPAARGHSRTRFFTRLAFGEGGVPLVSVEQDESEANVGTINVRPELPQSLFAAGAELPCTVKLRVWEHDIKDPCAPLVSENCCLTISHAVLCSEMGAHFSPCGRYLVACVACLMPQMEGDSSIQLQIQYDMTTAGTSPTRHPFPSHRIIYELRIYSLESSTFGNILASRAIRAAHCLTSIQFSPTSEHILLAYGRRHSSLLRSICMDGETPIPVYTILEVYRVSDMELVKVLPSTEDEVNVACFHPSAGAGLVYGTKEGKLRILQHDAPQDPSYGNFFVEENMLRLSSLV